MLNYSVIAFVIDWVIRYPARSPRAFIMPAISPPTMAVMMADIIGLVMKPRGSVRGLGRGATLDRSILDSTAISLLPKAPVRRFKAAWMIWPRRLLDRLSRREDPTDSAPSHPFHQLLHQFHLLLFQAILIVPHQEVLYCHLIQRVSRIAPFLQRDLPIPFPFLQKILFLQRVLFHLFRPFLQTILQVDHSLYLFQPFHPSLHPFHPSLPYHL